MSQRTTQLKFHFSDFQKLENLIRQKTSEQYKIKAFGYTDMIELKDQNFKHTLYFNKTKESKVVTKRKRWGMLEITLGLIIVGTYSAISYSDILGDWDAPLALVQMMVLVALPSLLEIIQPSRKKEIEEKHEQMKDLMLSLNSSIA